MEESKCFWVAFNLVKGIGAARTRAMLDYFGDLESAWEAPANELEAAGLGAKVLKTLLEVRRSDLLEKTCRFIDSQGITVLTWQDESYPRRLSEVDLSPPVLYVLGELSSEDEWAVAIVGTRRFTAYGRQATEEISEALAGGGITVVSGLARGIDAIAHRAALKAGGRTIAVLGSGLDQIYPPEHHQLAQDIASQGALLSDYPPGTAPEAINFPPRNRIISGLSRAVVVVEAGEKSGALITAAFAAEQGREVFAVPGSIYAPQCKGSNLLIQQGARALLKANDLLAALSLNQLSAQRQVRTALPADAVEAQLYSLLARETMHIDEIYAQMNLPIETVSATLTLMELKGLIRQVGIMSYIAIREAQADYQVCDEE